MTDTVTAFTRRSAPADAPSRLAEWPAWPTYGLVDDLLPTMRRWHDAGQSMALATLVSVTGSSPRPVGSEMAINERGEVVGYVSGGCVEAAVATQALEVIRTGRPMLLDYGAGSPVLDVQLTCGGRIGIFVHALADAQTYLTRREQARAQREPLTMRIDLDRGRQAYGSAGTQVSSRVFHQRYLPPPRLVLVGGDPVTLALCQLAPTLGYEIALLRPYGPPGAPPGTRLAHYDTRPLERALADLIFDASTAVYTLTHDMDDDEAVIVRALGSPAFSIGALGSRRKAGERERRLRAAGFADDDLKRLHTPAGVDIRAQQPQEIALSMLAELVAARPRVRHTVS